MRLLILLLLGSFILAGCTEMSSTNEDGASTPEAETASLEVEWSYSGSLADGPMFRFKLVDASYSVGWTFTEDGSYANEDREISPGSWTLRGEAWNDTTSGETCSVSVNVAAGDDISIQYYWDGEPGMAFKGAGYNDVTFCSDA